MDKTYFVVLLLKVLSIISFLADYFKFKEEKEKSKDKK